MEYICKIASPVGMLTASSDGENITGLWIESQKYFGATLGSKISECDLPIFGAFKKFIDDYFKGSNPKMDLPISPKGSAFRKSVWQILIEIPYGETVSYGEIAEILFNKTGKKQSARAVGGAVGHNPISIIIPCHRVIGKNGSLTGYAGGIDIKTQLLKLEGII